MGKLDYDLMAEGWLGFDWILRINNEHDYLISRPIAGPNSAPHRSKILGESVALTFTIHNRSLVRNRDACSVDAAGETTNASPLEGGETSGQSYLQMLLQIRSRVPSQRNAEGIHVGSRVYAYPTEPVLMEIYAYRPNVEQLVKSCTVTVKQANADLGDFGFWLGRSESLVCAYIHKHEVIQSMNGSSFSSLFEFVDMKHVVAEKAFHSHISLYNPMDGSLLHSSSAASGVRILPRVSKLSISYVFPQGVAVSRGDTVVMNFVLTVFPDSGKSRVVQAFSKSWKGSTSVSLMDGFITVKILAGAIPDNKLSITNINMDFLLPDSPLTYSEPRYSVFRQHNQSSMEQALQLLDSENHSFLNSGNQYETPMDFDDNSDSSDPGPDGFEPGLATLISLFRMRSRHGDN